VFADADIPETRDTAAAGYIGPLIGRTVSVTEGCARAEQARVY
jgi:hypothetical protein